MESFKSTLPTRQSSLSSLQLTPRVRELSSRLPSPAETPRCVFVQLDTEQQQLYNLPTDPKQFDRATTIRPCSMMRPHMRIFYLSWMSAITGFFGWYAIPPLMPIIKVHLGLTDGEVLNSDIASTASTIFSRIASGPLLDRFGPQVVQSYVLWLGCIPIICAAFVNSATMLLVVRFFIGLVGCIFVTSQYWTTITFARNVAGTANAVTGGLGLSGIGFAFLVIPFVFKGIQSGGVSEDMSWRLAIALPVVLMLIAGTVIRFAVDSCPTGDFEELKETKRQRAQQTATHQSNAISQQANTGLLNSFKIVLSDKNVLVMVMHYAACFGTELQLNNMGALYFNKEFLKDGCIDSSFCSLLSTTSAATVASSFGLMNMFARALGGLASDAVNRRLGMRGRRYTQFTLLCVLGSLVLVLSKTHSLGACIALYVLVAIAAQATGGSTYGIVPYLNEQHTGTVNGLVGAGGNFGGATFGIIFRITGSYNTGMFYMSMFIFGCALLTPLLNFSHLQLQGNAAADINDHQQHSRTASKGPFLDGEAVESVELSESHYYRAQERAI
ncbi:High-affinity nitrate transporter 2.1 [Phytophthora boehmeriae]|uniref:High-affinity nitrate transporter 2.1 n=1 Tax=Phytophthora boehmeriae TaxID=109152 RepID=A0A8T1WGT7_9STRA|nr:High-affinity nitrate transporter 2.1 [Phytophthora boehmeriae]